MKEPWFPTYPRTTPPPWDFEPRFFLVSEPDALASAITGRDITRIVEMVQVEPAPFTMIEMRVEDRHRQRWPQAYRAFAERWQRLLPVPQPIVEDELARIVREAGAVARLNAEDAEAIAREGKRAAQRIKAWQVFWDLRRRLLEFASLRRH